MFSRWDLARSAEAMFSRWAIKRVCKFLLKKRLGDFILGDIDLDQLDVQLTRGTIHLSDLALNADLLNQKMAGSAVMLKEGSIASLSIKIPWNLQNCQIEVEELELVLAPYVNKNTTTDADVPNQQSKHCTGNGTDKADTGSVPENSASVSLDIHEGVKTVAKIVKWFLTSFHVRLRNLIVAFDPRLDMDGKATDLHRSLVLRLAEIEYGTCVSEDPSVSPNSEVDSLFGKAKLTNFVKFQGAFIEFLNMDDVDNSLQFNSSLGTSFSEWHTGNSTLGSTVTILAGANGGFSGRLNLSIPWKNGSLDIRKVDADFSVDPLQLSLQPSAIKWLIVIWESLKTVGVTSRSHASYKTAESIPSNSRHYNQLSSLGSSIKGCDAGTTKMENLSKSLYSAISEETFPDVMLPRTHVIHNWVPLSINEDVGTELEQDYGASIDQFFECFDGIRSSQANSGNSGIWHWTCSVFSAITVASNLASGSVHIPIEQQNVETSLRAAIAEVSVLLSFDDGKQNNSHDLVDDKHLNDPPGDVHGGLSSSNFGNGYLNAHNSDSYMIRLSSLNIDKSGNMEVKYISPNVHHLEAKFQNVAFNLQISPQKTKFEASIMRAKVYEYHDSRIQAEGFGVPDYDSSSLDCLLLSKNLQKEVQRALPPFPFCVEKHDSESSIRSIAKESKDGLVKVVLFESFGIFTCHFAVSSIDLDGITSTSTSFSVHLPPFIFWIHFAVVIVLLNLLKQVESSLEESSLNGGCSSGVMGGQHNPSVLGGNKTETSPTHTTTVSSRASLHGSFFLPHARIIFCFPSEYCEDFRNSSSFDKFIILEHSPSQGSRNVSEAFPLPANTSSSKGNSCPPSTSIQFSIGDFDVYLAGSDRKEDLNNKNSTLDKQSICAVKILSGTNGTVDHQSGVAMIWQKGPFTGPWVAGRAWSLASSHDQSRNKVAGKSCEFSSVTTAEDTEETSSHIRQELILSSAFFLHVRFSHIWFNLSNRDLILLNNLLKQSMNRLSNEADSINTASSGCKQIGQSSRSVDVVSQSSILIDCGVLDLCIKLDEVAEVNYKIQKELEGSWNSFRLNIKKLELLSVSNIGGLSDATLFWLSHGEGELWGSVLHSNKKAEDLLLVTCSNSTIRRGDGKGANALSFGSAGMTIQYLQNPQELQSSTSVIVRGGTIIAPGGRLDWVSAICLFFGLPHDNESGDTCTQSKSSADDGAYRGSFFLDLVDVALSYEPYTKDINGEVPDAQGINSGEINEGTGEQCVAGLLAAASLSLSNYASTESATTNYNIQVQDVGLLICESSGPVNATGGYHASDIRKAGYVKVAQVALVQSVIRIKDLFWEIDCAESHINLDTCHDTTNGLIRLGAQLQQLYAPDIEDALSHLQSRWNTVQQKNNECIVNDVEDNFDTISVGSNSEKLPNSDDEGVFVGLLDEILENAFNIKEECRPLFHFESHPPGTEILSDKRNNFNISTATSGCFSSLNSLYEKSKYGSGSGNSYNPSVRKISSPQIIESYYLSEVLSPSKSTAGNIVPDDRRSKFDVTVRNGECGKGGWYEDDSLMIVENHISKVSKQPVSEKCRQKDKSMSLSTDPPEQCREKGRIQFKNIGLKWRMYAGLDWSRRRKVSNLDSHGRDESVSLELVLSGLNLQTTIYPDGEISVSKLSLSVQDFHLCDRSQNAPWKMVLGYYNSKDRHRESCAKALQLDLETVRPDPLIPVEDYRLVLECMPMRLHLDQGQLNFLISFFGKGSFEEESPTLPNDTSGAEMAGEKSGSYGSRITVEEALLPFFQKCDVKPLVVCIDYIPRHIDLAALRRGNFVELLNLVPWKGIELQLKHVCATGVYGWDRVCETVAGQWLEDISNNQVHKLLKGLPPIRSLFAVSSGTAKLVSLPVKSYRKDQKFLKGLQRGAITFLKSISLEAVGLGVHLAAGAHEMLLQTEYILTSTPPSVSVSENSKLKSKVKCNQPEGAQQGIHQAYESLSDGLGRTASALIGTPLKAYQRGAGAGAALATAVRGAPAAVVAPVTASARAAHCTLLGMRNSLDPDRKKESMEKYLGPSR